MILLMWIRKGLQSLPQILGLFVGKFMKILEFHPFLGVISEKTFATQNPPRPRRRAPARPPPTGNLGGQRGRSAEAGR